MRKKCWDTSALILRRIEPSLHHPKYRPPSYSLSTGNPALLLAHPLLAGCRVRVCAAAQVQKEFGRGWRGGDEKRIRKNCLLDSISGPRQKPTLGRLIRGRPHKSPQKVSAGLPRGTKSTKLRIGEGWVILFKLGWNLEALSEQQDEEGEQGKQMIQKADTRC